MSESTLVTRMSAVSAGDRVLAGLFNDALQADDSLRRTGSDGIAITVNQGVITLSGHVRSTTHKTRADNVANRMSGIVRFENQLVVDEKLVIAVANALANDKRMHNIQIGVNAQRGFIYLTGRVPSAVLRLSAAKIAAGVSNVRGIVNRIQAPDVATDDAEEQIFQPIIGQVVYSANDELGIVHQVIIHPYNRRVIAIVVSTTLPEQYGVSRQPNQLFVAIEQLRCAPSGALFLKQRADGSTALEEFYERNFIAPSVDWRPPFPYYPSDVLLSQ